VIVPDTVGVDEGAGRTLADHLQLSHGLDENHANLAATVTKSLCHITAAGNREYLAFFTEHQAFIVHSVDLTVAWLAEQAPSIALIFKPAVLATIRARAIYENNENEAAVDQLLLDAINGGQSAPEGTPRRALAKQLFEAMSDSFSSRKKMKRADMLKWVLTALKLERDGVIKNILSTRLPGEKKRRGRKPAQLPLVPPPASMPASSPSAHA
jgi:hypothetical protein